MFDIFKLLHGAVSNKDFVPVLTHFAVKEGRAAAFDGRVYLSMPAPELKHLTPFTVPAGPLLAALAGCGERPAALSVKDERLLVAAPGFRARLPIGSAEAFPFLEPPSKFTKLKGQSFLAALKALRPFMGDDATRPWCSSILLRERCAYASNNVVLAERVLPLRFPRPLGLPVFAVDELLRIDLEPTGVAIEDKMLTFFLPGEIFLQATLFADPWPDPTPPLKAAFSDCCTQPVPTSMKAAVDRIRPLLDSRVPVVEFDDSVIKTGEGEFFAEADGFESLGNGKYHVEPLLAVLGAATEADWSKFPKIPWRGADGLSGVFLGIRT